MDTLLAILRDPAWASIGVFVSVIALLVTSIISIKALPRNVKPNQTKEPNQTELTENISSSASINGPMLRKLNLPRQVSQPSYIRGLASTNYTKISFTFWGSLIILLIGGFIQQLIHPVTFGFDSFDTIKNYTGARGFYYWAWSQLYIGLIILYNYLIWTNFLSTATSKLRAKIGAILWTLLSTIEYLLVVSKIVNNNLLLNILGGILGGSSAVILLKIKSSKDNLSVT